ncbi:hypothetical protein SALBM135S_06491 [Streptomyces alboniger]
MSARCDRGGKRSGARSAAEHVGLHQLRDGGIALPEGRDQRLVLLREDCWTAPSQRMESAVKTSMPSPSQVCRSTEFSAARTISVEGARDRRGDLGVDLVRRDLQEGLVGRDLLADLLQPAGDGALGDGFAERGQGDLGALGGTAGGSGGGGRLGLGGGLLLRGLLLGGGGRGLGLGRGGGAARVARAVVDDGQLGADLDGLVLGNLDGGQDARRPGRGSRCRPCRSRPRAAARRPRRARPRPSANG